MARDAQASLRMPSDLKERIKEIAGETHRSLSNTIELLLRRGVEVYTQDGMLVDTRPKDGGPSPVTEDGPKSKHVYGAIAGTPKGGKKGRKK